MPARNPNPMTDPSPAQERSGAAPGFTPGWSHTVYTPGRTRNLGIPERALINFERALAIEEPSVPQPDTSLSDEFDDICFRIISSYAPGFTPSWSHTVYTPGRTRNLGIPERALINFERALAFEEPSLPSVPYNIGEHIHIGGYHGPRWQMMANAPGNHHHRNTSAPQVEAEELQPGLEYNCPLCNAKLTNHLGKGIANLRQHMRCVHLMPWWCHICNERFSSRNQHTVHFGQKHPLSIPQNKGYFSTEMRLFDGEMGKARDFQSLGDLWFPDGQKIYDVVDRTDRLSQFYSRPVAAQTVAAQTVANQTVAPVQMWDFLPVPSSQDRASSQTYDSTQAHYWSKAGPMLYFSSQPYGLTQAHSSSEAGPDNPTSSGLSNVELVHISRNPQHPSTRQQHPSTRQEHPSAHDHPSTRQQHPSTRQEHPSAHDHPSAHNHPSAQEDAYEDPLFREFTTHYD